MKVYSECFVFCGVFHENTREISAKCAVPYELVKLCPLHRSYHYCWQPTNIRMVCGKWYLYSSQCCPLL